MSGRHAMHRRYTTKNTCISFYNDVEIISVTQSDSERQTYTRAFDRGMS